MEIILQQDFPALGYVGDKVKVKPGYARNYLIPREIGVEASSANERLLKHRLSAITAKKVKLRSQAQEIKEKLEKLSLSFVIRMGGSGRSFGSVSVKDVDAAIRAEGYQLDRRQIKLVDQIKKPGTYSASVKLHSEVTALVPVVVTAADAVEKRENKEAAEPGEKKKGSRKSRKAASEEAPAQEQAVEKEQQTVESENE